LALGVAIASTAALTAAVGAHAAAAPLYAAAASAGATAATIALGAAAALAAFALGRRLGLAPTDAALAALPLALSPTLLDAAAAPAGWRAALGAACVLTALAAPDGGPLSFAAELSVVAATAGGAYGLAAAAALAARRLLAPASRRRRALACALGVAAFTVAAAGPARVWLDLGALPWLGAAAVRLGAALWPGALHALIAVGPQALPDTFIPLGVVFAVGSLWLALPARGRHGAALLLPSLLALAIALTDGANIAGAAVLVLAAALPPLAAALLDGATRLSPRDARGLVAIATLAALSLAGRRLRAVDGDAALIADAAAGAPRDGRFDVAAAGREHEPARALAILSPCVERGAPDCARARGRFYLSAGRFAEAEPDLVRAGEAFPEDASVWFALGRARYALGRAREARDTLARGFVWGEQPEARLLYGQIFEEGNQPAQAALHYRRAFELDGELWRAAYQLGLVKLGAGDSFDARLWFLKALPSARNDFALRKALAQACANLGAFAEARMHLEAAAALQPNDAQVQALLRVTADN
jgi:tetratricopeptide (TPR) repeat protein